MKYSWKSEPVVAKARSDLARLYRKIRRESPALGRLMFARYRAALKLTKDRINRTCFGL